MLRLRIQNSRAIFFFLNQALMLACDQTTDYLSVYQSAVEPVAAQGDVEMAHVAWDWWTAFCRDQNSAGQLENHIGHAGTQLLLEWASGEVNSLPWAIFEKRQKAKLLSAIKS